MELRSEYRKLVLNIVAKYKILPATEENIRVLINAMPELESVKKFNKAYDKLRDKPYQLLKKKAVFYCEGKTRDAIVLTKKGVYYLKEHGYDFSENEYVENKNLSNIVAARMQYRINESAIFILSCKALQKIGQDKALSYFDKNNLMSPFSIDERFYNWKKILNQYRGSRFCGVLQNDKQLYAVYDLRDTNIEISDKTENAILGIVAQALRVPTKDKYDKILLASSFDILSKTIIQENITNRSDDNAVRFHNIRFHNIFMHSERLSEIDSREKMYMYVNTVEQVKLINFFERVDAESKIREYIRIHNEEIIKNDKNLRDRNARIGTSFGKYGAYETDEEVGLYIVQQDLTYIYAVYRRLLDVKNGKRAETRHFKIYGVPENREIYERVFAQFENIEFVEMDTEELLRYINK